MGMERLDDGTYLISGKIRDQANEHQCLHIGGDAVAEAFKEFVGKVITLRYWVFNKAIVTVEEATELMLESIFEIGAVHSKCIHHWSEMTGYLYTTEECVVGGHDMLFILKSFIGLHVLLEVKAHEGEEPVYHPNDCRSNEQVKSQSSVDYLMNMFR